MTASIGIRRALVVVLLAAPACFAQGRVSEFLGVQNWHGTITIQGSGSGSTSGGIYSDVWQYGITSSITIQLTTYDPNIQGWTGTFTGTSNIDAKDVASYSGCKQTLQQTFQGPLGVGKTFTMYLQGTNQYVFYPSDYDVQGATSTTSFDCVPGSTGGTGPATWSPVLSDKIHDLPATGFTLTGSQTVMMDSPEQPLSLVFGGQPAQTSVTISWNISPGLVEQAEVVVQKDTAFQNWRPTAGARGARGNSLDLTAKLQSKGGGPTNERAAYFIWELTKSSKEPGYAMNAELDSPSTQFDLKLESGPGGVIIQDANAQKAQSNPGQLTQSSVTVASYDWGAFGTIKVTAVMPDGSQIVGHLDGDPAQEDVRLPMRSDSSLIADVWKQANGVMGLADVSDNESDPPGDGHAGDGLTLYEEYRGFIIDGQHVEGNPKKKDYFIVNTAGQSYQGGIKMFENLSGLAVHYRLKQTEMPMSRVINPNHGEGAHVADQHGIVLVPIAADAPYARAVGGPGTPKSITQVVVPTVLPSATGNWIAYLQSTLAHELFHACNVYHHGEAGYPTVQWDYSSSTHQVVEAPPNIEVTVLDESGAPYPLPADKPIDVPLGVANDPHAGNDNCVMRYDDSRGYYSKANPATVRYCVRPEPAGQTLCSSPAGTGINASDHMPQPRYGDAAANRGNCRGQILVNDNVAAPRR